MTSAEIASVFTSRKVCVIIPTYNNDATLGDVIRGVRRHTSNIIVVNDGSTDRTDEILNAENGITIVSYPRNRGKGFALRTGFQRAVEQGYDYAITIDSDGQHYPDDLPLFLRALEAHPAAIVIGSRNMEQANVPGKSSFGNKFSNFWFRLETGLDLKDTQSGYRLYPVRALHGVRYYSEKYEFEIEVLVRASWSGIAVVNIPIRVFYPVREERITHFRPFLDFARISILNAVLVTVAIFYIKPRDLYLAFKKKIFASSFATSS